MIISHKHRFIFVHNPKVAGTSVRKVLSPFHDDPREFWHQGWLPIEERVVDLAHLTADLWTPVVDPKYTTFGFVRDPYERFVSGVKEVLRRHSAEFACPTREFILTHVTKTSVRWDWRFIHLCPQHYFFYLGNKLVLDKVGRMETLVQDWGAINSLVGLNLELPKERVSGVDINEILDDSEVLAHVNSLYLRDFLLFGYTMRGGLPVLHHSERVNAIHDPSHITVFSKEDLENIAFTAGEKIALNRRINATDYSKSGAS